jgi:hypothetical protein
MKRIGILVLALVLCPFVAAHAETSPATQNNQVPGTTFNTPDLLLIGAGYTGFDKFNNQYSRDGEAHTRATDIRMEYRWGYSLYKGSDDWFDFAIHPLAGGMVSSHKQLYGFGGLDFDFLMWKHLVVTESEAVGLFDSGNAKPLGSVIEFRSQLESGWRFDNDMRLTAFIGHISNAGITHRNPGEEIAGGYVHIPVKMLFGG